MPVRMALIKNTVDKFQMCMQRNGKPFALLMGLYISPDTMEHSMKDPKKKKKMELQYNLEISLLRIDSWELKTLT